MVLLFRCLTHDNKWLSGNECLIAFVRARSSSDPNIGDDGASMSSRLSVSKNLEKVEKSELPCMRIGPKNRGCVFVDCLSRAMFLKVVTVTCNCDKYMFCQHLKLWFQLCYQMHRIVLHL